MRRSGIIAIGAVAVLAGGYFLFFRHSGDAGGMPGGPMPVSASTVLERETVQWDDFSGRLMAADRVEIRPRVGGTIEEIAFKEGELVKKGQRLFLIDPKPYQAAVQSAKARAVFAQNALKRARVLLPEKAISQREYDEARNAAEVADADLTKANLDLSYTDITSPIDGRVGRAEITLGNLVESGGNAPVLTRIVSEDPIYADFDVDEQNFVRYLRAHDNDSEKLKGMPVKLGLSGQNDFPYEGRVKSFDNELNTGAGTVRVRAEFDNANGALISGLFARVRIGGEGMQKLTLITDQAIGTDQNRKFVYVIGADNTVSNRVVTLGPSVDGLRVVQDGLKPGEKIVVSGLQRLHPGVPVQAQMVPMDDPNAVAPAAGGAPAAKKE